MELIFLKYMVRGRTKALSFFLSNGYSVFSAPFVEGIFFPY
jgi:hypothetical protein